MANQWYFPDGNIGSAIETVIFYRAGILIEIATFLILAFLPSLLYSFPIILLKQSLKAREEQQLQIVSNLSGFAPLRATFRGKNH
jgi:hypothetical protein